MKINTLRSKGFSVIQLAGPVTRLAHREAFTVNHKPARQVADRFEFCVRGWYGKEIPREIVLL